MKKIDPITSPRDDDDHLPIEPLTITSPPIAAPSEANISFTIPPMDATFIMIGNPGAGKSTLLSSLVDGTTIFSSGASIGSGKTTKIQEATYNGNKYIDTPGLSDVKLRKDAAAAIESAFKKGGKIKTFFVVTLESGRVKPDDIATIKLVLDAVPQIGIDQYSILINKVSAEVLSLISKSKETRDVLVSCFHLPTLRVTTNSIFYVPTRSDWVDQPDKWGKLSYDVLFFISNACQVNITSADIKPINSAQFEAIFAELKEAIRELRAENQELRRAIAEQDKRMNQLRAASAVTHLFIGNYGPTLVNRIAGNNPSPFTPAPFKDGVCHIWHDIGRQFVAIPNLADTALRQQVAAAIEGIFRSGGQLKVFFVLSLTGERVTSEDIATMKLVLAAIPFINSNYAVIGKQLSAASLSRVKDEIKLLNGALQNSSSKLLPKHRPKYVCLCENYPNNAPLDLKLKNFINDTVPTVDTAFAAVEHIKWNEFETLQQKIANKASCTVI